MIVNFHHKTWGPEGSGTFSSADRKERSILEFNIQQKYSFKNDGEIKKFSDKGPLREFRYILKEWLKIL